MNYTILHLTCYIGSFHINIVLKEKKNHNTLTVYFILILYLKRKKNHNTLTVPFEKSKTLSLANSIMKYIFGPSALVRFSVKLTSCIAFVSA